MSSVTARVFKGCRALLAPATAAKSAAKPAAKDPTKFPKKPRKTPETPEAAIPPKPTVKPPTITTPGGFRRPRRVSAALGQFLGAQEVSRVDAVKQLWTYIKSQDLQNPANKREIICDEKLKAIFDGKEKVHILEVGKLLSPHFVKDG